MSAEWTPVANTSRILVVDDDAPVRSLCRRILERQGYHIEDAGDGESALELLDLGRFDLVITDLRLPGMQGIEVLRGVKSRQPDVEVIVMTAHGTVQNAIEAMKQGALDFLLKPFDLDEFSLTVGKALERRAMAQEIQVLRHKLSERHHLGRLYGKAPVMQALYQLIDQFAPTNSTVMITGESGTGKEVLARTLHARSSRANGPFVAVNCAAIVREIFESELFGHARGSFTGATSDKAGYFRDASGGTLFLDEVTEMPTSAQVKLLRVLQEREVVPVGTTQPIPIDVRVIAASNQDLDEALRTGALRQDLYFRLNVIRLELPPLRDRVEDVPLLAMAFVKQAATRLGRSQVVSLAPEAVDALCAHRWPGNVRELQNVIEYAVALTTGSEVKRESLPSAVLGARAVTGGPSFEIPCAPGRAPDADEEPFATLEQVERMHIERALRRTGGHRKRAAELLGIDPKTLYRKLLRDEAETSADAT